MTTTSPLRVLHTSDWHLGRMLHGRQRHEEFAAFLSWLHEAACAERADILLAAGDIFDTATPGAKTQQLYYDFLCRMAASPCRHLVITAGNHDSPSFLSAPKDLLRRFDIHVIGAKAALPADEALLLRDADGQPEAVVCAVPYLRDRDLRCAVPGQSIEERERDLAEGIRRHYAEVCAAAAALRQSLPRPVPIIGMGHLFAAGGSVVDGDGSRSLYVGSLACVEADAFPPALDYVALGHLHAPQKIGGSETRRYSGSPLAMSFADAGRQKSVCVVDFTPDSGPQVRLLPVPVFQELRSLRGAWPEIVAELARLRAEQRSVWLEIVYQGEEIISDLRERAEAAAHGSRLEILRLCNPRLNAQSLSPEDSETLAELSHEQVFRRCLDSHKVPETQRPGLLAAYQEITRELLEADPQAGL
uniref:exonuclease SbcCD subunit D C-terminal domain-containing protein n=1 Tax=Candidatus Electronema sp. TaxID=2698783 RepID=UPI004056CD38